jgi:2-succinyl-5-enolpyruvyl-6-hydroxy-3-cyclohexene-1-carboxylate synthase
MAASALNYVAWGALVGGSSLPVREIDAHLTRPGPVFGNRGASGIDGFVSTARGVGSALDRTIALSGDLTLLHDSNGLLNEGAGAAVLVVIDNAGGGLFDSLPQHRHAPDYERLFVAAQDRSIEDLARLHRLEYAEASTREALADIAGQALDVGRTCLIRVPVDRHFDLEARRRLDDVASGALNGL